MESVDQTLRNLLFQRKTLQFFKTLIKELSVPDAIKLLEELKDDVVSEVIPYAHATKSRQSISKSFIHRVLPALKKKGIDLPWLSEESLADRMIGYYNSWNPYINLASDVETLSKIFTIDIRSKIIEHFPKCFTRELTFRSHSYWGSPEKLLLIMPYLGTNAMIECFNENKPLIVKTMLEWIKAPESDISIVRRTIDELADVCAWPEFLAMQRALHKVNR